MRWSMRASSIWEFGVYTFTNQNWENSQATIRPSASRYSLPKPCSTRSGSSRVNTAVPEYPFFSAALQYWW